MDDGIKEKVQLCKLLKSTKTARHWLRLLDASAAAGFEAAVGRIEDPSTRLCALTHAGRYAQESASFGLQLSFSRLTHIARKDYQALLKPWSELEAVSLAFKILRYNDAGGMFNIDSAILQNLIDRCRPDSTMTNRVREETGKMLVDYLDDRDAQRSRYRSDQEHTKTHMLTRLFTTVAAQRSPRKPTTAGGDVLPFPPPRRRPS